jgi:hypothetical protein
MTGVLAKRIVTQKSLQPLMILTLRLREILSWKFLKTV